MTTTKSKLAVSRNLGEIILATSIFLCILILGTSLRTVGLDWDQGHLLHPDERFLSWVAADMRSVSSIEEYLDTPHSLLNPNNIGHGFYVYGDWPVILLRYVGEYLGKESISEFCLLGRALSTIADLSTVLVLFLLGKKLHSLPIGLLAAALYATAAFPIQQSHFFTVDTFTNLFVVTSFYFAAHILKKPHWVYHLFFGISFGLALSSKISVFPLAIIPLIAQALYFLNHQVPDTIRDSPTRRKLCHAFMTQALTGLAVAGLATILTFRIGQPYAFLPANSGVSIDDATLGPGMDLASRIGEPIGFRPNPLWLAQMSEVRRQVSGEADIPPNHQWAKRLPLIFPWLNMVRIGMGWPLGLWCWFAFAWAIFEIARRHSGMSNLVLPVLWIGLYFTWQGMGWVTTMRYFLPVYPLLILLGSWAIWTIWHRIHALLDARGVHGGHWSATVSLGLVILLPLSSFLWGFAVSRIYTRPMTRVAATDWILTNIPSDVTLLIETPNGVQIEQIGLPHNWPPYVPEDKEDPAQPPLYRTYLSQGVPAPFQFQVSTGGSIASVRINHIAAIEQLTEKGVLHVSIATDPGGSNVLAGTTISDVFRTDKHPYGESYEVRLEQAMVVLADQTYWLILEPVQGSDLIVSGSVLVNEDSWDDALPLPTAPFNIWDAQYHSYVLQVSWPDNEVKLMRLSYILDHADYIIISSNRFYDSLRRNPQRWPLTMEYYRALFSSELGFELVADFTSRPNLGPLEFYDDNAEEAWTVYDHPRVMIFAKSEHYNPLQTAKLFEKIDFGQVRNVNAKDAQGSIIEFQLP